MSREYNTHHVAGQHLTFSERQVIAAAYNANLLASKKDHKSIRQLAKSLGLSNTTLQREIKRGQASQPNLRHNKEVLEYSESIAQDKIDDGNLNKGCPMKLKTTNGALLKIEIVDNKRSPYDAIETLRAKGITDLPCTRTVYNHIDHGDLGIRYGQTPNHPNRRKKTKQRQRKAFKCLDNLSIEDREDLSERLEVGHWELDCIVSCVGGQGGLLVAIDRKSRFYVIVKLKRISQSEVIRAIKYLIRKKIMNIVKTITTDNGSEFLNSKEIVALFKKINAELKLYYTHPYSAWEKGSVENANRLVRRFYPKGFDFANLTVRNVGKLQDFINSIHRKALGGLTAKEAHEAYCKAS